MMRWAWKNYIQQLSHIDAIDKSIESARQYLAQDFLNILDVNQIFFSLFFTHTSWQTSLSGRCDLWGIEDKIDGYGG